MYDLNDFLTPINVAEISEDTHYNDRQMGRVLKIHEEYLPDLDKVDIVIVGVNEFRGAGMAPGTSAYTFIALLVSFSPLPAGLSGAVITPAISCPALIKRSKEGTANSGVPMKTIRKLNS